MFYFKYFEVSIEKYKSPKKCFDDLPLFVKFSRFILLTICLFPNFLEINFKKRSKSVAVGITNQWNNSTHLNLVVVRDRMAQIRCVGDVNAHFAWAAQISYF